MMFGILHRTLLPPTEGSRSGVYFVYSSDGLKRGLYVVSGGKVYCIYDRSELADALVEVEEVLGGSIYQVSLTQEAAVTKDASSPGVGTRALARKNGVLLAFNGGTGGKGSYGVRVVGTVGCEAGVDASRYDGTVNITKLTGTSGSVTIEIDCEGVKRYERTFQVVLVSDGAAGSPGAAGAAGADGKTAISVYRRTETAAQPATPVEKSLPPVGWSVDASGSGGFVWESRALFNLDGSWYDSPDNAWSVPVRLTGDVGATGETGPSLLFRGAWDSGKSYFGTGEYNTAVRYNGKYYVTNAGVGLIPSGVYPTDPAYWHEFDGQFESVATGLLLAEEANIAGWVFKDTHIESQNGNVVLNGQADDKPKIAVGAGYSKIDDAALKIYEDGTVVMEKASMVSRHEEGGVEVGKVAVGHNVITKSESFGDVPAQMYVKDTQVVGTKSALVVDMSGHTHQAVFVYGETPHTAVIVSEIVDTQTGKRYGMFRGVLPDWAALKSMRENSDVGTIKGGDTGGNVALVLHEPGTGSLVRQAFSITEEGYLKLVGVVS